MTITEDRIKIEEQIRGSSVGLCTQLDNLKKYGVDMYDEIIEHITERKEGDEQ